MKTTPNDFLKSIILGEHDLTALRQIAGSRIPIREPNPKNSMQVHPNYQIYKVALLEFDRNYYLVTNR
jgi:hypothetical protein